MQTKARIIAIKAFLSDTERMNWHAGWALTIGNGFNLFMALYRDTNPLWALGGLILGEPVLFSTKRMRELVGEFLARIALALTAD